MFIRVIPNNKGSKSTYFCDLVESFRDENGVPRHRTVVKLGQFDKEHVLYLRAAFSPGNPAEVVENERKKFEKR